MRFSLPFLVLSVAVLLPSAGQAQFLTRLEGSEPAPAQEIAPEYAPESDAETQVSAPVSPEVVAAGTLEPEVVIAQEGRFLTSPFAETSAVAAPAGRVDDAAKVDIQANSMTRDERANTVVASGDVMIVQAGRIMRADSADYNVGTDTVHARGNVVLNEESGDIHLADEVTYNDKLQNGTVSNLRSTLNDGSRFVAVQGERKGGTVTVMNDAFYTPCEPCKAHPESPPVWDLVASRVTHDEEEHRISYRNARLEAFGVPVLYTPYFSHPDGSVQQKSGFLAPTAGYKSSLGAFVEDRYYWGIAPDQDATVGLRLMTEEDPLATAEYRKRWTDAALEVRGGVTESGRTDRSAGQAIVEDKELRGHVFAKGEWDMTDKWRSGLNINWTSDDQYMRQYDFTDDDVLDNEIYAERFSGRDYASARLISYQDIRLSNRATDQPDVLPEVIASFKGDPGAVPLVKGQWSVDTSMLGLMRDGSGQDMNRFGLGLGWDRRLVSDYGFLTTVEANARGDFYQIGDKDLSAAGSSGSTSETASRYFPQLHVKTSYPMARPVGDTMQARIEPVAALTAAPNISYSSKIPNEDSNNVQLDASNILEASRFPGIDRVEDQSHMTYGLRGGLFGNSGDFVEAFLGQSYRLSKDDNPFSVGSGLDERSSDVVGQLTARYNEMYNIDYRFQLAADNLTSVRHEVEASADWNRLRLNSRYLYARGIEGTDVEDTREQLQEEGQFYFNRQWRARAGATHDFSVDEGLRRVYGGLDFMGQCLFLSLTGQKNYTTDTSGDGGTEVMFRVGLKNLGGFQDSGLRPDDGFDDRRP
jgi:LPS-assembly protein